MNSSETRGLVWGILRNNQAQHVLETYQVVLLYSSKSIKICAWYLVWSTVLPVQTKTANIDSALQQHIDAGPTWLRAVLALDLQESED